MKVETLTKPVGFQLDSLLAWAKLPELTRNRVVHAFQLLTREALEQRLEPPFKGLSRINADGLPLQWVFRFGQFGSGLGFLCEVGEPGQSPQQRLGLSVERLGLSCDACGLKRPDWLPALMDRLVPSDESWPTHWRSAMWIGVAASKTGIHFKPYFNLNRDSSRERWLRAGWVLKLLGRERALERLCDFSRRASAGSWPVGLAVDVLSDGSAGRVKIYFRSLRVHTAWLQHWYHAAGYDEHFGIVRRCLDLFPWIGKGSYPEGAFVLSVEFHPQDGKVSLKTDFGVTKWIADDERIAIATCGLLSAIAAEPSDVQAALYSVGAWPPDSQKTSVLRFVGLGSEPDSSCHVNLYVEPPLKASERPALLPECREPMDALSSGLRFLMSMRRDGHWTDFSLPVGESHSWVTAYVLTRLGEFPAHRITPDMRLQIEESLDWLLQARTPKGGWGYNESTEDDADSTSWAILALRSHGRHIPDSAQALIRRCERPDGGIATYPDGSSSGKAWKLSVPDVTAVAMNAMGRAWSIELASLFQRWQRVDGTFSAYWWASPLYTYAALIDWLSDAATLPLMVTFQRSMVEYQAQNGFEQALLLRCLLGLRRDGVSSAVTKLLRYQKTNGSWPSSALLRLTSPEIAEPWSMIDTGPLYFDQNEVFTTVTALSALAHYL